MDKDHHIFIEEMIKTITGFSDDILTIIEETNNMDEISKKSLIKTHEDISSGLSLLNTYIQHIN